MRGPLETLCQICAMRDVAQLISRPKEIVPEYNPSSHLLQRALAEQSPREERRARALAAVRGQ